MRLYAGSSTNFIALNFNNQIADLIKTEFRIQFGYNPSINEVMSWQNSLYRFANMIDRAGLHDNGILVEYQLPLCSKRIDIIITGTDSMKVKNAVIIELKQWSQCTLTEFDSDKVVTWVGGGNKHVLHPSIQAGNYKYYLQDNNSAFYDETDPIHLYACCFLHNYYPQEADPIFDRRFESALTRFPIYTADNTDNLSSFLCDRLNQGEGMEILSKIENSKLTPSRKLLKQVSGAIKEKLKHKGEFKIFGQHKVKDDYTLLDEQLVVYDTIMSVVRKGLSQRQQYAVIVKGGAGTGKSVIGLQLLADLAALGYNAHYATGSGSFTKTLRKIVGSGTENLFKYFMSYGTAKPRELDVLIMDEAHRIREKTGYPFRSTGRPQVEDLIRATKVALFFIDDFQCVRKGEIGSSQYIKEQAERLGCNIFEYELESQFRCGGSDGYANWIDNTLHIKDTANAFWSNEPTFEFKIFDSPEALDTAIRHKNEEGYTARIMAGFCWKWSKELGIDHTLINDVKIGTYKRPWNARPDLDNLPIGIPKSDFWAYDKGGIDQVGCIYTAQGFEFDYAGVIFGTDLRFNLDKSEWDGHPEDSFDEPVKSADDFLQLVKNTYRVLLTRGMKGCYVYFMDKDTERFFRSRIKNNKL